MGGYAMQYVVYHAITFTLLFIILRGIDYQLDIRPIPLLTCALIYAGWQVVLCLFGKHVDFKKYEDEEF